MSPGSDGEEVHYKGKTFYMSTQKKPVDIALALRQLKALKIPTFKKENYDARKLNSLTKSQKETIRKNYREYEKLATAPKEYVKKNVSKLSLADQKALKAKGYKIIDKKLFVDKQGFDKVELKTKTYVDENGKKIKAVKLTRKKEGEASETEYHMRSSQFSNLQEMLLQQYERGNFKDGDYMGVKIGAGGRARRVMMLNVNSIYKYLVDDFEPKDNRTDKDELLKSITLIKIGTSDRTAAIHARTKKEQSKLSRQRSKNRASPANKLVGKVSRSKKK